MSVKQQLHATIDSLPEALTLEESVKRLYQAFKLKRTGPGEPPSPSGAMDPSRRVKWTQEDYLAFEARSTTKHEFLAGEIYDMAGASFRHNAIASKTISALDRLLSGRPCQVFNGDQRICVAATGLYTYADAGVVCGRPQFHPNDDMALVNPLLLVEVLSESTASYDRGEKLAHYRRIPGLQQVLLVAQDERLIEHHHQIEPGRWLFTEHREGVIDLPGFGGITLDELYAEPDLGP